MILLLGTLLLCTGSALADIQVLDCTNCEFSVGGIGYLETDNCVEFLQCYRNADGSIGKALLCCANGTYWNQDIKNCEHGDCGGDRSDCPNKDANGDECKLWADESDQTKYFVRASGRDVQMMCPAKTVYRQEYCGCVHGAGSMCYNDPLLHFPFAKDYNDIQCPKAQGTPHGGATLDDGYLRLNGIDGFMTFSYLNNWFERNNPKHFTLSMWFKQTQDAYNSGARQGLFSNGDCNHPQSVQLNLEAQTANGGICAAFSEAFEAFDSTSGDRGYGPADEWIHIAIRSDDTVAFDQVTLFLNGVPIDTRTVTGDMMGTMSDASVGLGYILCEPFFFEGCIDDVMVFVREVSDNEILNCVYGNGRTEGADETMYTCAP